MIELRVANADPAPGLVELLERMLADARSGELREIAVAGRLTGDEVVTYYGGENMDLFRIIGAMRLLEHRLLSGVEVTREGER